MGINYLAEHKSCIYYDKNISLGFKYFEIKKNISLRRITGKANYLVFVLKGSVQIRCNEFEMTAHGGEMIFIHRNSLVKYKNLEDSEYIVAIFENITQLCVKIALAELVKYKQKTTYEIKPFKIKEPLEMFLTPLTYYLKDGANCKHLHDIKIQEMFWIFRAYYSKEELASFLYMIIGESLDFRYKVLDNYTRVITVHELANICGMSVITFKRQFMEEFGEAPSTWLQKRLVSLIIFRLADHSLPLKQIIDELNFSSLPNFVRFCKKYLGESPGEIRKQINARNHFINE